MDWNLNDMKTAHVKLWAQFTDVKLWAWTFATTTFLQFVERYIYADWEFLKFLLVLMALDLFTGIIAAIKERIAVTSYGLRRSVLKGVQYGVFLIVMHVLSAFTINGEVQVVYQWVTQGAYIFLIGIEGKSILENIAKMDDRFDVAAFIDRIKEVFKKRNDGN